MAKKIKFALEMENGVKVRTLEDLQANFSIEAIVSHFLSGKLLEWLEDRYYDEEAEKVRNLSKDDAALHKKLCEIFDVPYQDRNGLDISELELLNEKREKLRQFTSDEEIIAKVAQVAFDQEELSDLLDADKSVIYLCGDKFRLPWREKSCHYIGISANRPHVILGKPATENAADYLTLENVILDN